MYNTIRYPLVKYAIRNMLYIMMSVCVCVCVSVCVCVRVCAGHRVRVSSNFFVLHRRMIEDRERREMYFFITYCLREKTHKHYTDKCTLVLYIHTYNIWILYMYSLALVGNISDKLSYI